MRKKILVCMMAVTTCLSLTSCIMGVTIPEGNPTETQGNLAEKEEAVNASKMSSLTQGVKEPGVKKNYEPLIIGEHTSIPEPVTNLTEIPEGDRALRDSLTWEEVSNMVVDIDAELATVSFDYDHPLYIRDRVFFGASKESPYTSASEWIIQIDYQNPPTVNYIIRAWHPDGLRYVSEETALIYSSADMGFINSVY